MEVEIVGEGDQIGSTEYRFLQIGEAVPIASHVYDSRSPPAVPLAVSQRSRLLFVAHSNGFYVARTKVLMAAAQALKDNGSGPSVHDLCTINISSIGAVSVLALSSLDSWLAASVDHHIHFFSMAALLHEDHHPSSSISLDQPLKDLKWAPHAALEKHYLALSTTGTLYHGSGPPSPRTLRTNVDAVEWSANGDFVALAQNNLLTILTSKFEEKTSFTLSPTSLIVDSIRWVSADRIVLGCFESDDDSDQAAYVVQVISTHGKDITHISSKPSMVVFHDMFLDYQCGVVPGATGPNMFVSYLEDHELAFVANRKNLSQHVVLLGWFMEDKNMQAAMVEISNDAWSAHIDSQENGDDNLILALSVDKVSHDEGMKFILGEQQKEVSPCCVLLCVTIDGKISLFHFASAADIVSSRKEYPDSDGQEDKYQVFTENRLNVTFSKAMEQNMSHASLAQEYDGLSNVKPYDNDAASVNNTPSSSIDNSKLKEKSGFGSLTQISAASFREAHDDTFSSANIEEIGGTQPSELAESPISHTEHSPFRVSYSKDSVMKARDLWKTESPAISEAKAHADVESEKVSTDFSSQSMSKSIAAPGSSRSSGKNIQTNPRISVPSFSLKNSFPLTASDARSSSSNSGAVSQPPSRSREISVPAARLNFSGPKAATMVENRSSSPASCNSQVLSQENIMSGKFTSDENLIVTSYPERSSHEQKLSIQFSNAEVLVKKMDQLLEGIQGQHGFKDASITSQEGSVAALEESLWMMSEECRMWRGTLEGRLKEIQLLLDKTVQVLARKVYMEGIFQQANDNWYSDLWNSQKLCLELDLKRQHIVEVDQELASQLVQLERHFNTIELNKFGESTFFQENQKSTRSGHGKPRQQSLRSLQNTVSAQLVAAEKLSVCLSEQMAALNLLCPDSKQNVKREVFETLGLTYDGAYSSSVKGKASDSPRKDLTTHSPSVIAKQVGRTNMFTPVKNAEPQTVRRQRNSLEQIKSSSVREKVTVKRILLQEDHRNCEGRLRTEVKDLNLRQVAPVGSGFSEAPESIFQYKSKNSSKMPANQFTEGFSSPSSHWTEGVADREIEVVCAKSSIPLPEDPDTARLNSSNKNHTISLKFAGKASGSDAEYAQQQSETFLSDVPSIGERTPVSMTSIKSPSLSNELGTLRSAIGEVKATPLHGFQVPDSIFNQNTSVSPGFSSSPHMSSRVLETEFSAGEIRSGQMMSFPVIQTHTSASNQVSSSATSTVFLNMTAGLKSHSTALGDISSTSPAKLDTDQKKMQSHPLFSSSSQLSEWGSHSSSTPNFVKESLETDESGSQPTVDAFGPSSDESSATQNVLSSSSSAGEEISKAKASVLLPGRPNDSSSNLSTVSEISTQATELPVILKSGNQPNLEVPVPEMKPNSTHGQTLSSKDSSPAPIFSGTSLGGEDLTNNEEDEMEEEAPENSLTAPLTLGDLGGFGFGSNSSSSAATKPNPFGVELINKSAAPLATPTQAGELFRPASFNFQSAFPSQPSVAANSSLFGSGFGSGSSSLGPPSSGFGQPAQFGSGQQALGSVLGAFGQSRQLGASPPGNSNAPSIGGFSSVGSGTGGFASLSTGGGFGAAATVGGGFASAATAGGGFGAAATAGGGFASAATAGGGFGAAAGGGFGNTVGGGFSAYSNSSGAGGPPSSLFTQMRK